MFSLMPNSTESKGELQLVIFTLGEETYGVDIGCISTIIRYINITNIPNMPEYILGVVNFRGAVIPIIDLKCHLGLGRVDIKPETRILVVQIDSNKVGMLVDAVTETLRVPFDTIESLPELVSSINTQYLIGVVKDTDRLVILIDLSEVLGCDKTEVLVSVRR